LLIPNLTYLGDPASVYAPYTPRASDSLEQIAGTFKTTIDVVATINRYLPGIFANGATITIDGKPISPGPLDSLQSVADEFGLPFDQFITKIKGTTNLYRTSGTVLTPLPVMPDAGSGQSPSLAQLVQQFNIQSFDSVVGASLLTTNRSLEGFLRVGA